MSNLTAKDRSEDRGCSLAGWLHPRDCRCKYRKEVRNIEWGFAAESIEQEQSDERSAV